VRCTPGISFFDHPLPGRKVAIAPALAAKNATSKP
jgi:hypothetical protein